MAKLSDLPLPERIRKTMFVAAPVFAVGTLIGSAATGHWVKLISGFAVAAVFVMVGIFAPQIVDSWEHRNDPRPRRRRQSKD